MKFLMSFFSPILSISILVNRSERNSPIACRRNNVIAHDQLLTDLTRLVNPTNNVKSPWCKIRVLPRIATFGFLSRFTFYVREIVPALCFLHNQREIPMRAEGIKGRNWSGVCERFIRTGYCPWDRKPASTFLPLVAVTRENIASKRETWRDHAVICISFTHNMLHVVHMSYAYREKTDVAAFFMTQSVE